MRLRARQHRFVAGALGGWGVLRLAMLWPRMGGAASLGPVATKLVAGGLLLPLPAVIHAPVFHIAAIGRKAPINPTMLPTPTGSRFAGDALTMALAPKSGGSNPAASRAAQPAATLALFNGGAAVGPEPILRHAALSQVADLAPAPPRSSDSARLSAETYLFVRPGSGGAALAAGGQLGGSQAALRLTYALNASGPVRTAVAARIYAPLASRGREAAVGLDWHPLPGAPFRISVERRQRLDALGRSALSAYAAGGFFLGHLPLGFRGDGYAQAGLVGATRRDGFVDGALRTGHPLALGSLQPLLGAGLWAAAQPGVARLDVGPRASVDLPVAAHAITVALEGRLRVAGHARPGSGVALTVAAGL